MAEYEYVVDENVSAPYIVEMISSTNGVYYLKSLFANANLSEDVMSEEELKNVVVRLVWTKQREDGLKLPDDKGEELISMMLARHKKDKKHTSYTLV